MLGLSEPPAFPELEFPVLEPEALAFPPEGLSAGLPMVSAGLPVDIDTLIGLGCVLLRLVGDVRVGAHVAVELAEDGLSAIALQGLVTLLDGVLGLVDDVRKHLVRDLVGGNLRHKAVDRRCGLRVGRRR